jgi:hypothetical protein
MMRAKRTGRTCCAHASRSPTLSICNRHAMAKAAGETLCRFLAREKQFLFSVPRYPRLLTDQTTTVVLTQTGPAAETVPASIHDFERE